MRKEILREYKRYYEDNFSKLKKTNYTASNNVFYNNHHAHHNAPYPSIAEHKQCLTVPASSGCLPDNPYASQAAHMHYPKPAPGYVTPAPKPPEPTTVAPTVVGISLLLLTGVFAYRRTKTQSGMHVRTSAPAVAQKR